MHLFRVRVRVMVFNATFNNITGISWRDLFLKTVAPVIIMHTDHIKSSNTYQKASEILVGVLLSHVSGLGYFHVFG